jgi:Protein of unknown function (DUF2939)
MRRSLYAILSAVLMGAAYIGTPFVTAWSIREAIQNGNSDYLEHKIEWDSVRATLRESLTQVALGQPGTDPMQTADASPKPGLWKRIKNSLSKSAVNNVVDNYVTPEGLPQLFSYRKTYRDVSGETAALEAMPWHERLAGFWSRIKRAEFKSPAMFEIEMADRNDPTRHYVGLLELRGFEWKLTELRLRVVREATLPFAADPA